MKPQLKNKLANTHYSNKLTENMLRAIDYIGRHRKNPIYPHRTSCPISMYMANKLVKYRYAMWGGNQDIMLTVKGEKIFTALHPNSKWRIS